MELKLTPGKITLSQLRRIAREAPTLVLATDCRARVDAGAAIVQSVLDRGDTVYGLNTGFGAMARTRIDAESLRELQRTLVLSHCTGTGEPLCTDEVVPLMLSLKVIALASGNSGVRWELVEALLALHNHAIWPVIPAKGSVGASGDLAPLAHLAAVLLGVGEVRCNGELLSAAEGLERAGLEPIELAPKEGLALLNGTQVSTALALRGLFAIEDTFAGAMIAGALSVDAALGSDEPFDSRIQALRGQSGQSAVAECYRGLLADSKIRESHLDCDKVQDPYSLRCQPQVMGACLDQIAHAAGILKREANAVTDNPLVFPDEGDILSGGNFHAEPVAMAADNLALAAAEIGAMSERRLALLVDPALSGLPPFLVEEGGLNSGFMMAQVTAASLASENKSLAHPASVDSIPTSANQEDHVSMATFAARRLGEMATNTATITTLELLAACQGIEFHRPLRSSAPLERAVTAVRELVEPWGRDRYFAPDIAAARELLAEGLFHELAGNLLPSLAGN